MCRHDDTRLAAARNCGARPCPGPGYPPNYLATDSLSTGVLTPVATSGAPLNPKGQIFVTF